MRSLRGGATLDYPVYLASSLDDHLGDGEKILNTTSARPGLFWGGLFHALQAVQRVRLYPYTLHQIPAAFVASYGPQAAFLRPCPAERSRTKNKNRRKAHLRARRAVLSSGSVLIFPRPKTPHRGRQRPAQGIKQPRPAPSGVSRGIVIAFALLPCSVPILHPTLDRSGQCSAHHAQRSKSDLLCHQPPHPPPICMRHSQYQGIGPFAPCLPPLFVPGDG